MYYKYLECFPEDRKGSVLRIRGPKVRRKTQLLKKLYLFQIIFHKQIYKSKSI